MNKTIYVRDEDVATWERAKELAGEKLAPIIAEALRRFVAEKEAEPRGFGRIELSFNDGDSKGLPRRKAFFGRWVFPPDKPECLSDVTGSGRDRYCAVAITAKGALVTLSWTVDVDCERSWERFQFYESFESAVEDRECRWAVIAAREKLGVPVEELDI